MSPTHSHPHLGTHAPRSDPCQTRMRTHILQGLPPGLVQHYACTAHGRPPSLQPASHRACTLARRSGPPGLVAHRSAPHRAGNPETCGGDPSTRVFVPDVPRGSSQQTGGELHREAYGAHHRRGPRRVVSKGQRASPPSSSSRRGSLGCFFPVRLWVLVTVRTLYGSVHTLFVSEDAYSLFVHHRHHHHLALYSKRYLIHAVTYPRYPANICSCCSVSVSFTFCTADYPVIRQSARPSNDGTSGAFRAPFSVNHHMLGLHGMTGCLISCQASSYRTSRAVWVCQGRLCPDAHRMWFCSRSAYNCQKQITPSQSKCTNQSIS